MPTEYKRTMHMLRVKMPVLEGDDPETAGTVDVPVIDEIWFKDEQDNSQRYHFIFRNRKTKDGSDVPADHRKVHTVTIASSDNEDCTIDCERIDTFQCKFPQQNSQKKTYIIRKGNASHIPVHLKTHDFVVGDIGSGGNWIKMQRIDKLKLHDAQDSGQVKTFILDWATYEEGDDLSSVADVGNLDDTSDAPWRFDPFQNPVDLAGHAPGHTPAVEVGLLVHGRLEWIGGNGILTSIGGVQAGEQWVRTGGRSPGGGEWHWGPSMRLTVDGGGIVSDTGYSSEPCYHWWVGDSNFDFGIKDAGGDDVSGPLSVDYTGITVVWGDRTYEFDSVIISDEQSSILSPGVTDITMQTDVVLSAGVIGG